MSVLLLAIAVSVLIMATSGRQAPIGFPSSSKSFVSGRASVSAGDCLASPSNITIPVGDSAFFTSPNYPNHYGSFQQCSWFFQTDVGARLVMSCNPVQMSWFSELYVDDAGTRESKKCFFCNAPSTYTRKFQSNTATVGLANHLWFTNIGFSCLIKAQPIPYNDGCKCGVIKSTTRIVGGQQTVANEYPWMVLLVRPGADDNFCGGSLITSKFVLTAAHCTARSSAATIQVRLGIHYKLITPVGSLRRDVLEIINHPNYNIAVTEDFDASLLRIGEIDFSFYDNIQPICLPTGSSSYSDRQAITAGWGTTTAGGFTSNVLMDVTVPVINNIQCNDLLPATVSDSMLCAGIVGRDSCQGDSGGPLFLSGSSGLYQEIIGIVSWGYGCGDEGFPGVYARVTSFKAWIDTQVASSTTCSPP